MYLKKTLKFDKFYLKKILEYRKLLVSLKKYALQGFSY